jgi:hypothetical protein
MSSNTKINLTQNGKLDKRFKETKSIEKQINNIKVTKSGIPDKRTKEVRGGKVKIRNSDGKVKGSSKIGKNMNLL